MTALSPFEGLNLDKLLQERAAHEHRDKGANHEHVSVGEVDQLDDPVDHRVAEGDQRVHGTEGEGVQELREPEPSEHHREERDDGQREKETAWDTLGSNVHHTSLLGHLALLDRPRGIPAVRRLIVLDRGADGKAPPTHNEGNVMKRPPSPSRLTF